MYLDSFFSNGMRLMANALILRPARLFVQRSGGMMGYCFFHTYLKAAPFHGEGHFSCVIFFEIYLRIPIAKVKFFLAIKAK